MCVTRAPVMIRTAAWTNDASRGGANGVWIVGELGSEFRAAPAWRTGARARVLITDETAARGLLRD